MEELQFKTRCPSSRVHHVAARPRPQNLSPPLLLPTRARAAGAHVSLSGRRQERSTGFDLPNQTGDLLVPIPWFPGIDALWLPSSTTPYGTGGRGAEVDTIDLVHPLSAGSDLGAHRNVRSSVGGGVGVSGLPIRVDAAREIAADGRWRVNLYAPIRF